MKSFDLSSCRSKLEDHYQKTATVPTSVWSKKSVVDIHQIYTRLSWVKDEQTPAGTTQSELKHYCDLFNANKNGAIPKRILVQGQTGIGKSTFVKKLLVDWVEVNKKTGDERAAVLKNFELVVAVNLKEVSKCQSLKDVISFSNVFAKEDKYMTEGLVDYIANNQEKVLLIFDGYDEYRCGCNSEIYEIFNGKSLRNCRVLITTRISKADELRGGEDLQAEITGFSEVDRYDFMRRFLSNDEISNLSGHLFKRNLNELAKVPLLLLFLCTLWKKGQSKHFPKTKTKLYLDIIEFVLNHSHRKQSSPRYVEVASFKDILSEMGKVALQGLLNDDQLFEYGQLSDSVRCDESVFIGLLQITEYSETLRPVGLVSFIHKSIQEFLAAWYVTYRCIPEGRNLGEIGVKLEECLALENVFQFICGLSIDGASTVFRHLKSVRISDPSLDLSKAVPDVENETDELLIDVAVRQETFRDLVLFLFAEVESEAEFSSSCLDSLGSILVYNSFPNYLLEKEIDTNSWYLVSNGRSRSQSSFASRVGFDYDIFNSDDSNAHGSSCEQSVDDSLCDLVEQVPNPGRCSLSIKFCALTSTGAVKLASLLPRFENVTFLRLALLKCSTDAAARLVAAVKHKTLKELLLEIGEINLTSALVEALCQSLSEVSALKELVIGTSDGYCLEAVDLDDRWSFSSLKIRGLTDSSAEATTRLIDVFDHNIFRELKLKKIRLTPAVAEVLVQLLPKLSALQALKIKSLTECSDEAVTRLIDSINHKTLEELELSEMNLTSAVAESLGRSLPELSALETLKMSPCSLTECSDEAVTRLIDGINHKTLVGLELSEMNLTSAVAESLGRSLPELSALETLLLSGSDGCNLQQKEMEALFGRFSRPSSLRTLSITCFSARGSLASLAKNLCFFPCLERLQLEDLDMGEADLCSFLENLKYIPDLRRLHLMYNPLRQAVRLMAPFLLKQKKLEKVYFRRGDASEEDLNYVQKVAKEKRPQLSIKVIVLGTRISFQL